MEPSQTNKRKFVTNMPLSVLNSQFQFCEKLYSDCLQSGWLAEVNLTLHCAGENDDSGMRPSQP